MTLAKVQSYHVYKTLLRPQAYFKNGLIRSCAVAKTRVEQVDVIVVWQKCMGMSSDSGMHDIHLLFEDGEFTASTCDCVMGFCGLCSP